MRKNIIITGTSRGIGLELVKILSKKHNILAISRNVKPLEKISNIKTLALDITQANYLKKAAAYVENHWQHVDIIIHNAGKLIKKPFKETTNQDFFDVYQVNVFAVAELTRIMLPYLKEGSHVLTISSMGGVQGSSKFAGLSAYSSSKGAVITLTELLAEEYKEDGIAFNALALGAVQTEMLKEAFPSYKAPTTANTMAAYIADFALYGSKYFNGKILPVANTTP
jgi:NAD(P)-dependent dehydrogenase (short-subunit alcohol dehydrogenase family)